MEMTDRNKYNTLKNLNLNYNMNLNYNTNISKARLSNTKYLTTLSRNAKGDTQEKVKEVIKLYSESKISQISSAENMILDLILSKKKDSKKPQQKNMISLLQSIKPTNH